MRNKILFVITKSITGGAQKFVNEQIEITYKEFDVFLCTNNDGWLTNQVMGKVTNIFLSNKIESLTSILLIWQLIKFIKKNKIQLVICNSANGGLYGRLAAFLCKIPSCYISHGWSSIYNGKKIGFVYNAIERVLSVISNKIICVSNNDYQIALHTIKINAAKLQLIKNATLPIYTQKKSSICNIPFKIISLARFANPKRIDLMVQVIKKFDNVTLDIAGNGPEFDYWKTKIESSNIKNVNLLGEILSFDTFNNYDAFMLISNSEGLPLSAIEAMSAGLPLILSNVGGCNELVENNGILVKNDIEEIENAIKKIITNYTEYQSYSFSFYNKYYNLENSKSEYLHLYQSLITST
jgi:O86/O127-antigen biosynthesis alpha-1,3-N-acetylgalactosaminyltransferase